MRLSSTFIPDQLSDANKIISRLKLVLDNFNDQLGDWDISKFQDIYTSLYDLLQYVPNSYNESELLFIAKSIYSTAGLQESLLRFNKFFELQISASIVDNELVIDVDSSNESLLANNVSKIKSLVYGLVSELLFMNGYRIYSGDPYVNESNFDFKLDIVINLVNNVSVDNSIDSKLVVHRYYDIFNLSTGEQG